MKITATPPEFTVEHDGSGLPICLPSNLDRSNLLDITTLGDAYRRYMDTRTGVIHDGAEYRRKIATQPIDKPPQAL